LHKIDKAHVLFFSTASVCNIFRYDTNKYLMSYSWVLHTNLCTSSCSVRYCSPVSTKTGMWQKTSVKVSIIKLHENSCDVLKLSETDKWTLPNYYAFFCNFNCKGVRNAFVLILYSSLNFYKDFVFFYGPSHLEVHITL
jgi:hypothetical protein